MKKGLIHINKVATKENTIESVVCFKKFIEFLEDRLRTEDSVRIHFYNFVLERIRQFPELLEGVTVNEAERYNEVLELVAAVVLPLLEDENEIMMGLISGIAPEVFYATNLFHRLFEMPDQNNQPHAWMEKSDALKSHQELQYGFVLQKIYNAALPNRTEIVRSFFNRSTGLYQYYRVNIDTRFVDLQKKPGFEIPTNESVTYCFECGGSIEEMEALVPLSSFIANGFCIVTLTDITTQEAVEQLSKIVVNKEKSTENFIYIKRLLQTIIGNTSYDFSIMPFLSINNRAAIPYDDNFQFSILIKAATAAGITKRVFYRYIRHYLQNPQWIEYSSDDKSLLPVKLQNALKKAGIHFYAMLPLYFDDTLVGVLETSAATDAPVLNELQFANLKPALPHIAQLMKLVIEKFNSSIDKIVKDRFTVIQPSVEWKFNEAAWHYFRSNSIEHQDSVFEKITFKNVYPLYGAVDIRNSTVERNKALREDLEYHLNLLIDLLTGLSENNQAEKTAKLVGDCRQWLVRMTSYVSIEEEIQLNNYLFGEVQLFLQSLTGASSAVLEKITAYYKEVDRDTGTAFAKRRQLEKSMQIINSVTGKYFDLSKDELQTYYPVYFEKFRTDGIEYDIYIGQSIAPSIPFLPEHLYRLRLWQVQSMAAVAKLTYSILPQLEHPLQTTQLIFVNPRSIDISFRDDEKRFDVEGAYNVRYHIVKKRIDKVTILHTNERLTQFGKIAIVYFNEQDGAEYAGYIHELQQQHILQDDLEYLELQELQGVQGLKALRVGVAD